MLTTLVDNPLLDTSLSEQDRGLQFGFWIGGTLDSLVLGLA